MGILTSVNDIAAYLRKDRKPLMRMLHLTSVPFGKQGTSGSIRSGDMANDGYAKSVWFEEETGLFSVVRSGAAMERVPAPDIEAVIRSMLRQVPSHGLWLTFTEVNPFTRKETIVKVCQSFQVDSSLGGHQTTHDPHLDFQNHHTGGPNQAVISKKGIILIFLVVAGIGVAYYYTKKSKQQEKIR